MKGIYRPILHFEDHQAELNVEFSNYLYGKSVAIVGRANLHDLEQGEFIDSHDVVVRVHSAIPYHPDYKEEFVFRADALIGRVPEEWVRYIGSTTNILYHRIRGDASFFLKTGDVDDATKELVRSFTETGGRFLCFYDLNPIHIRHAVVQKIGRVRYLDYALLANLALEVGVNVILPGINAIGDILRQPIKSAYITGFPCYFNEYMNHKLSKKERPEVRNLRFLNRLVQDDRVSFDKNMLALFREHCG